MHVGTIFFFFLMSLFALDIEVCSSCKLFHLLYDDHLLFSVLSISE